MHKLVYLFELDSVRNNDDQMEEAMSALYREIVINGNAVAITYNQLFDSRFFLSLLNNEKWADCVMKLFKEGAIKISQYGKYRTPTQYLISAALDSDEEYVFSGLPILSIQKSLIALAKRSLMYSDLSELNEYLSGRRSEKELRDLFKEQRKELIDNKYQLIIKETTLKPEEMKETLNALKAVLKLILQFGDKQNVYNPPKEFNAIKEKLTLSDFIARTKNFHFKIDGFEEAVDLLNNILKDIKDKNKRSDILKHIKAHYHGDNFVTCAMAEAILDLCYNYVCEASISNISKHYNIDDLKKENLAGTTFANDFLARFKAYYDDGKNTKHFLKNESNRLNIYNFKKHLIFNLIRAEHLSNHAKQYEKNIEDDKVYPYEYHLSSQRIKQRCNLIFGVGKKLVLTIIYLMIAFYLENYIYGGMQDFIDQWFRTTFIQNGGKSWIITVIASFLAVVLVQGLSNILSNFFENDDNDLTIVIPSFGESLENIAGQLGDLCCAIFSFSTPYANKENKDKLKPTLRDKTRTISFVSKSVTDYKKYRQAMDKDLNHKWMFEESKRIPLMDIDKEGADEKLTRIEEMLGTSFGITYNSNYHKMIVDPAIKTNVDENSDIDNIIYPYERLANVADSPSIVSIPIIKQDDKTYFILLKQYRHAIRKMQYAFPRGFGENGLEPIHNAQKELWEEIGAVLYDEELNKEIHYDKGDNPDKACKVLGAITIDSGSLCETVHVVMANVKSYQINIGYEGIVEGKKISEDELKEMIANGEIDDSFTIEAYALYSLRK